MPKRGEENHNATLSDGEVSTMRDLYEQDRDKPAAQRFWTQARLAEKFETSRRNVRYIVNYRRRA